MTKPHAKLEAAHPSPVAGVDEVGRGCIAGPVCAAAVILPPSLLSSDIGIKDSKLLSAKKRSALAEVIWAEAEVGLALIDAPQIDEMNILRAALLAMARAVADLPKEPAHCLIDGNQLPDLPMPATAVVGGDRQSISIAAASIIAKTHRDALMQQLHVTYPAYGWDKNAGYGTKTHREALALVGPSPQHRRSFKPLRS
ncbi:MAG: ribonuclease HII [Pseudomonadota bacterium]